MFNTLNILSQKLFNALNKFDPKLFSQLNTLTEKQPNVYFISLTKRTDPRVAQYVSLRGAYPLPDVIDIPYAYLCPSSPADVDDQ